VNSFFPTDKNNILLESLKMAEDEKGYILLEE